MGISTLQSYQSARIFEAIGLGREVIDRYFTGTVSRVGGIGIKEIEEGVAFRHDHAFDPLGLGVDETLDSVGFHYLRSGRDKEDHMYSPETIIALQRAVRTDSYEKFREYTDLVDDAKRPHTLRGLLEFVPAGDPVPIEEVEPASEIVKRFGGHWAWGGGWLSGLGFHDFAGSAVVHNVGGVIACLGAWMLGPRIGKYDRDGKVRAIPGHNMMAVALGVFILWFCWFGFNGGSTASMADGADAFHASLAFMNTNLAAAVATVVTMIFTWLRYGKPDVSMTLNASLAGLVAITAGCDCVSPLGAFVIGVAAGFLVVLSVEFFDNIAKIDDPVGAVSVHMVNGIWGTIAVGLFSTGEDGVMNGLFYGGGAKLLGVQALGIIAIDAYVVVTMFVVFKLIDRVIGLRVPAQVEIDGLDMHEHGLASAYSGFSVSDVSNMVMDVNENTDLGEGEYEKATQAQIAAAVKVTRVTETGSVAGGSAFSTAGEPDTGMHKVAIICRLSKFDELKHALNELGVTGMTMTQVMGCGIQKGSEERYRGAVVDSTLLPKVKVEVIVSRIPVERVIESAKKALYTGHIGDGKIFVYNVMKVIKVRTGEEDFDALQDVE